LTANILHIGYKIQVMLVIFDLDTIFQVAIFDDF